MDTETMNRLKSLIDKKAEVDKTVQQSPYKEEFNIVTKKIRTLVPNIKDIVSIIKETKKVGIKIPTSYSSFSGNNQSFQKGISEASIFSTIGKEYNAIRIGNIVVNENGNIYSASLKHNDDNTIYFSLHSVTIDKESVDQMKTFCKCYPAFENAITKRIEKVLEEYDKNNIENNKEEDLENSWLIYK